MGPTAQSATVATYKQRIRRIGVERAPRLGWLRPTHLGRRVRAHSATAKSTESLPHARLHDLRHIYATTLLRADVPVHVAAVRLGHTDPSIALKVSARA